MNARLLRLRAELRSDRQAFEQRVEELSAVDLGAASADEADRAQVALALHHAYGAVESLLTRVARVVEGSLPEGADWHQALLAGMCLEIEGVRPAVLRAKTAALLQRLLSFRHFLRHAYTVPLDGARLARLQEDATAVAPLLSEDLQELDVFLQALADDG